MDAHKSQRLQMEQRHVKEAGQGLASRPQMQQQQQQLSLKQVQEASNWRW
jgi:hypothetical protein